MRTNKKIGILIIAAMLAVSLILFGCSVDRDVKADSGDDDVGAEVNDTVNDDEEADLDSDNDPDNVIDEDINEEDNGNSVENDSEEGSQGNVPSTEEILEVLDGALEDFDVKYIEEDNAFVFESTNDIFTELTGGIITGDRDEELWEAFPETILTLSEAITDGMENAGKENDYTFAIRNPVDEDVYLLIIRDDKIVYDFIDDL